MKRNFQFNKHDVAFDAEGVTLRGWLYKVDRENVGPAIVLAPGYNCLKEFYFDKYAEVFASAGFNVLVFDNRNFGASDGLPRQELDPWQQVNDYRHAITYMQSQDFIDPNKIGIWGTSYSGGHVLVVAAIDKRVKAVVSQVPTISGHRNMLRRIKPDGWQQLYMQFNEDRMARFKGMPPQTVPTVAPPESHASVSHATTDAWDFFTGSMVEPSDQWRFKEWKNEVTLRSIEMYSAYEPGSYIDKIAPTPLLMLVAKQDVVSMTDEQVQAFNQAGEIKKIVLFDGGHFDAYIKAFTTTAETAASWFEEHLY